MKYIIIGLGHFGSSLAEKLTEKGNEVFGVDIKMERVEHIKDKITHAVNLDATDPAAVSNLPLRETDLVIIAIGENKGANIMTTALMKRLHVKKLISRAVDPLQEMVLQAMGIEEIIHPEEETAERWSKKLNLHGVVDSFELNGDFSIIETKVPEDYEDKSLAELEFREKYDLIVLTTMKVSSEKNELGASYDVTNVQGVANAKTILHKDDIMVIYGNNKNIKRLLDDHEKLKDQL